ncbi:ribosomal protein S18 acetylase RimI-like enzyme [Pedobacter cryoconitis]|uniref:Ribosomal protein S18 acetylase RimI-like enzyme n=1 Tax=Pedobacter cryoconitis TaxID=188932 RepID=A0A7W9E0F9_9SPHI|nr:GNAT family N-acetyltransferase [Pedobacter cryoconitis]MBB5637958.1 ribosomal protein S18 acetylase RimI-like enzyme [Pedobacter cryoconitis]MBB6270906.1 ribosomal protein S18 acetylase RimI-like enzyme [Pedobacter cryoconitis]
MANKEDLHDIIKMMADDPLGNEREIVSEIISDKYLLAFENIMADSNQELTVAIVNEEIVGTFQLTFIQYLNFQGGLRAQIEAVRTNSKYRGLGIGTKLIEYGIKRAKSKNCHVIQLTSDKTRKNAIRFYEKLGFKASHEGMKLKL